MKHLPLSVPQSRTRLLSVAVSVGLHLVAAIALLAIQIPESAPRVWVEMVMNAPQPSPEPEPPPQTPAETPKTEIVRRAVAKPSAVEPSPAEPSQIDLDTPRPRHRVQGLSSSSFLEGSGTGLAARAGNSLSVGATEELLGIADALPWSEAGTLPRCNKPAMEAPDAVRTAGIEGTVEVSLDLDATGAVVHASVSVSLSPEADAACLAAWKGARCSAGRDGERAVAVRSVPFRCTYQARP